LNEAIVQPLYETRFEEIGWGVLLVAVTMAIHGFGMVATMQTSGLVKQRFGRSFLGGIAVLIAASWLIIVVHLLEVGVWSRFFLWKGAMPNASLSFYFALMDYTTLGSNYNLPLHWRLLEGMIAIAGLLTFAWSTGVLFTLAQEFQDQQVRRLRRRLRERHRHHPPPPHAGSG